MLEACLVSLRSALTTVFYGIVTYGRPPFTIFEKISFFIYHILCFIFRGVHLSSCDNDARWIWLLDIVLIFGIQTTFWIVGTIFFRFFLRFSTSEVETPTTPTVPSCSCRRNLPSIMRSNGVRGVHERGCGRERVQTQPNKTTTVREQKRVCKREMAEIKREMERNTRKRLESKEDKKRKQEKLSSLPLFPHSVSRMFSDKLSLAEKTTVVSKIGVNFNPWEWTEVTVVEIRETTFFTDNGDNGVEGLEKIEG